MQGTCFSHYRILDKLGEGGMGVVYSAEDTLLGRRVAVKFPTPTAGRPDRLLSEARAASALNHPAIAAIYDCGEYEGRPYIVMELVEGQSLRELLREGPLPVVRSLEIVARVAEALGEAHNRRILHRDIKPSNIRINQRGAVKVVDFGLAKELRVRRADAGAATGSSTASFEGAPTGTPPYMSPEQARGYSGDERSDIFSLGAVLYECLAGRPAFTGASHIEVLSQVLHVDPPPVPQTRPEVPPELEWITRKALAKNPADRYQQAADLQADLEIARSTLTQTGDGRHITPPATPLPAGIKPRRKVVLAALAGLALALLGGWLVWPRAAYQPNPEALRWFERGTTALRDGTYYRASKALEQAVQLDDRFALAHARLAESWNELADTNRARQEMLKAVGAEAGRLRRQDELTIQAIHRTLTGDFAGAVSIYREILRQAPDAGKADAFLDLGRACEKDERAGEAIKSYQEAIKRSDQYAAAHLRLGILHWRNQEQAAAEAAFGRAESVYRKLSNLEGQTEVLYQRSVVANDLGHLKKASSLLEKASSLLETVLENAGAGANPHQQIRALLQLSSVMYRKGDAAEAETLASEAIKLARSQGLEPLITRGLADLGNAYLTRGDREQAEKCFQDSLKLAERLKLPLHEARALLSLGSLRIQYRKPEEGIRYVERGLAFYEKGGYQNKKSDALLLLGRAWRDLGDFDKALQAFKQQLELAGKVDDPLRLGFAQEGLGTVLLYRERFPEALAQFQARCAGSKSRDDNQGAAYGLAYCGRVLWNLGRYKQAAAALAEAMELATRPGGYAGLAEEVTWYHAEMALSDRQFLKAREGAQKLLSDLRKAPGQPDVETLTETKRILGLAQLFSGARGEGRTSCKEALDLAEKSGIPRLVSKARLCYAEALLENGETAKALQTARSAQEQFVSTGQKESEARAWLIAAHAAGVSGNLPDAREFAGKASQSLAALQTTWTPEDRKTYDSRPDVRHWRGQIERTLAGQ